jgi:hypothetical protein
MVWVLSSVVVVLASVVSAIRARETLCLHEVLSQLRFEFEIVLVQLLTHHQCPTLAKAMPNLWAKKTFLHTTGVSSNNHMCQLPYPPRCLYFHLP